MAFRYGDSFSVYGASNGSTSPPVLEANLAQLQREWNLIASGNDIETRNDRSYPTGSGFVIQMNTNESITQTLDHQNRWIVGFRMRCDGVGFGGREFYSTGNLINGGSGRIILLYALLNTDGTISLQTKDGTPIATSTVTVAPGDWHYYEIVMFFDDSDPTNIEVTAQCYLDNVLVVGGAAFSGVPVSNIFVGMLSQSATTNTHSFLCPCVGTGTALMGDLYILDTNGTDNVSRLGPIKLGTIHPASDHDTQWTPSAAGTHFSLVNENPEDLDTTYVASSTVGNNDTYFFDTVAPGTIIPAVQIRTCCRKTDQGVRTIQAVVGPAGAGAQSPSLYLGGNYVWGRSIFERDPSTSMPWVAAGVNATEFGPRMVS